MEPERCLLDGTVFLGTIVVTDGSKFERKRHTRRIGDDGGHKKCLEGKKRLGEGMLRCGEAWFATVKAELRNGEQASLLRTRRCGPSLAVRFATADQKARL